MEKRYDAQSDSLFLIYYALPPGFNANNWGVSHTSLDVNIKSAVGKPVIIRRKEVGNPFHSNQAGNYVHPLPEEAGTRNVDEYLNWQEKWAVGRVRSIDKRDKGYAWTLEITDPEVKNILKSDEYKTGIPGWTSPQILTFPNQYPDEERTKLYDHWMVSHVILTDSPAYGFEKSALAGKCLGPEQKCMIQTRSASSENIGFCVKQATIDLVNLSSQGFTTATQQLEMSSDTNATATTGDTIVTHNPVSNSFTVSKTLSEQGPKQEPDSLTPPPKGSGENTEGTNNERSQPPAEEQANLPKTLEESHALIQKLISESKSKDELLKNVQKDMKNVNSQLAQIQQERKQFKLMSIVPRDLFKSDESYMKEIERVADIPEDFLVDYYKTKKAAQLPQQAPIPVAKSASSVHEVPNYSNEPSASSEGNVSSVIQKQLELQRMITGGDL